MLTPPKWLKVRTSHLAGVQCAPNDSADMTPHKCFRKVRVVRSTDPVNFMALNANSSKIAKDRNFKFGTRDHSDSPYMTLDKMTP